jgi:hypothetical protein
LLCFFARLVLDVVFNVDIWLLYASSSTSLAIRLFSITLVTDVETKIIMKSMLMQLTRTFLLRHVLHANCVPIRCRLNSSPLEDPEVVEDPGGSELDVTPSISGIGSN